MRFFSDFRMGKAALLGGACLLMLAGCSWVEDWPPAEKYNIARPEPKAKVVQTADATWIEPVEGQEPVEKLVPAPSGEEKAAIRRLNQLEDEVAQMRNDMSMMMPALTRLANAQSDLHQFLSGIQPAAAAEQPSGNGKPVELSSSAQTGTASGNEVPENMDRQALLVQKTAAMAARPVSPAPVAQASAPVAAPPAQHAAMPARGSPVAVIENLRVGEHPDKTRLVLDTSSDVAFRYDVDNSEGVLLIELPNAGWNDIQQMQLASSPVIASYQAVPDGKGGTNLAVQLRQPVTVLWADKLPPVAEGKTPRIVIDIAPL